MKGLNFKEFMDELYACGDAKKDVALQVFSFQGKRYSLGKEYREDLDIIDLVMREITPDDDGVIFKFPGETMRECVEKFEKATVFDGKTINQAEKEIAVLFS